MKKIVQGALLLSCLLSIPVVYSGPVQRTIRRYYPFSKNIVYFVDVIEKDETGEDTIIATELYLFHSAHESGIIAKGPYHSSKCLISKSPSAADLYKITVQS